MMDDPVKSGLLVLSLVIIFFVLLQRRKTPPAPLPPGPKGLPLLGSVTDFPIQKPWKTFAEWGGKYGE